MVTRKSKEVGGCIWQSGKNPSYPWSNIPCKPMYHCSWCSAHRYRSLVSNPFGFDSDPTVLSTYLLEPLFMLVSINLECLSFPWPIQEALPQRHRARDRNFEIRCFVVVRTGRATPESESGPEPRGCFLGVNSGRGSPAHFKEHH